MRRRIAVAVLALVALCASVGTTVAQRPTPTPVPPPQQVPPLAMCPAAFADFTLTESGFTILIRRSAVTAIRPFDNPPQPYVHIDVGAQTYTVAGDLPLVYFKVACPI